MESLTKLKEALAKETDPLKRAKLLGKIDKLRNDKTVRK